MRNLMTIWMLAAMVSLKAQEVHDSVFTKTGFPVHLYSEHLGQERKIFIHLPVGHDTSQSYPLVVLLDGEVSFKAFAGATELMSWQRLIPPCIVVGIVNVQRDMDYAPLVEDIPGSGRADTMLAFYRDELFPYLEERFNISGRIIWGHSWTGFFVTYTMLKEPSLFDAYIVTSPALDLLDSVTDPENPFGKIQGLRIKYFMSLGGEERVSEKMKQFISRLENDAPETLEAEMMIREGKNHDSNALPGYMDGLEFVFRR
ncbi:MAG: alpha/beta hydrolase [Bacteroidetes bacterium]|nr:MAG: alpha/beta hydrolase [Bacteroidota bacterium]